MKRKGVWFQMLFGGVRLKIPRLGWMRWPKQGFWARNALIMMNINLGKGEGATTKSHNALLRSEKYLMVRTRKNARERQYRQARIIHQDVSRMARVPNARTWVISPFCSISFLLHICWASWCCEKLFKRCEIGVALWLVQQRTKMV